MSVFEYLGILVSVVMGLGLTHLLTGLSKTIHHRDTLDIYPVHLLWVFNVALYIVGIWWGMFWWSDQVAWSFPQFLFILLYAVLLFLLASLLFPWDFPIDQDFLQHFHRTRPWFFGVMAAAWLLDIPETLAKGQSGLRGVPPEYGVFVSFHVISAVVAARTGNRRFHAAYSVAWPLVTLSYLTFTTLSQIAR